MLGLLLRWGKSMGGGQDLLKSQGQGWRCARQVFRAAPAPVCLGVPRDTPRCHISLLGVGFAQCMQAEYDRLGLLTSANWDLCHSKILRPEVQGQRWVWLLLPRL